MALQNLTPEQLSSLRSGNAEKIVTELHDQMEVSPDGTKKIAMDLGAYWGLVRFALTAAKVFTPEKIDLKIDELIRAGDEAEAHAAARKAAEHAAAAADSAAPSAEVSSAESPAETTAAFAPAATESAETEEAVAAT